MFFCFRSCEITKKTYQFDGSDDFESLEILHKVVIFQDSGTPPKSNMFAQINTWLFYFLLILGSVSKLWMEWKHSDIHQAVMICWWS